jgi:MFS family permease
MATPKQPAKPLVTPGAQSPGAPRPASILGGLGRGFRALRIRNYRLFWTGQLFSLTGTWMQSTAQDWLVLQMTQSPFALGLVATLQFLPVTLLSLHGGVIADMWSKRKLLFVTQLLGLIQALIFGILVATGAIQIWHIYVLAGSQGIVNALSNPTRQAFAVELVGRDEVVNAVALNSMLFNGARIVGPAAAGLLIALVGTAPALFINAASFIAILVALVMMDESQMFYNASGKQARTGRNIREGLAYAWHTPAVLAVLIVVGMVGTFGYNFSVVLPLLAGFVLHTNAAGFGGLTSFLGFGSLLGAIGTAYTSKITLRRLLIGAGLFSIIFALLSFSSIFPISAALLVALGFAGVTFGTTANTLIQLTVPDELRGRVMGLYVLLFMGSTPIGSFFIGTLSNFIGVTETLLICAALCALGVGIAWSYQKRMVARMAEA